MNDTILFIGLDTHKEFSTVAVSSQGRDQAIEFLGKIKTTKQAYQKLVRQLQSKYSAATLHFVYEAGPFGYWIYRLLSSMGHACFIVAPSLIPKKPGDRVKTDKRDAMMLCELLKQGAIEPIYVPEAEDEAMRDLSRARERAMRDLNDARYQLKAFLLRNHIIYDGKANWSLKHLRWLTELVLPHPSQQIVLQEHIQIVNERTDRLVRMDNELDHQARLWRYYPVVKSIQAMRGIQLITAVGLITELGDLSRFDNPRKLMSYVGLVPSEHSSGGKRHLGAITKAGNTRARRLLIESAHSYRYSANISTALQKRQETLSKEVIDIAWAAQQRLCRRFQRLQHNGKHRSVITAAIAREIIAYVWVIAREVPLRNIDPKQRLARVPA